MSICSFHDKATQEFFERGRIGKNAEWRNIAALVRRKLDMLHYATTLMDLRSPPGNRLKALRGILAGYHSIRVNDQWRILYRWTAFGPAEVRVIDYH